MSREELIQKLEEVRFILKEIEKDLKLEDYSETEDRFADAQKRFENVSKVFRTGEMEA